MHWGGPGFVISIVAIVMVAGLIKTWIRARHGYPISERDRRKLRQGDDAQAGELGDSRKVQLLTSENERLNGQVGRLEDRIAVLERIVTDPAERTARDIDALR